MLRQNTIHNTKKWTKSTNINQVIEKQLGHLTDNQNKTR